MGAATHYGALTLSWMRINISHRYYLCESRNYIMWENHIPVWSHIEEYFTVGEAGGIVHAILSGKLYCCSVCDIYKYNAILAIYSISKAIYVDVQTGITYVHHGQAQAFL